MIVNTLPFVSLVILLALIQFMVFGFLVGQARGKYGVKAPATSGNEVFERYFRVHYNTLEQLLIFVPAIAIFGLYMSDLWGAVIGAVFILGRAVFAVTYIADPGKRALGFVLSFLANSALVLGGLFGVIKQLLA
jgi:glutathione S-transferase